ncbi:hypothetical protein CBL_05336 [Carabus blaptoides fortunei]
MNSRQRFSLEFIIVINKQDPVPTKSDKVNEPSNSSFLSGNVYSELLTKGTPKKRDTSQVDEDGSNNRTGNIRTNKRKCRRRRRRWWKTKEREFSLYFIVASCCQLVLQYSLSYTLWTVEGWRVDGVGTDPKSHFAAKFLEDISILDEVESR